jgi:hypothetical protein
VVSFYGKRKTSCFQTRRQGNWLVQGHRLLRGTPTRVHLDLRRVSPLCPLRPLSSTCKSGRPLLRLLVLVGRKPLAVQWRKPRMLLPS